MRPFTLLLIAACCFLMAGPLVPATLAAEDGSTTIIQVPDGTAVVVVEGDCADGVCPTATVAACTTCTPKTTSATRTRWYPTKVIRGKSTWYPGKVITGRSRWYPGKLLGRKRGGWFPGKRLGWYPGKLLGRRRCCR